MIGDGRQTIAAETFGNLTEIVDAVRDGDSGAACSVMRCDLSRPSSTMAPTPTARLLAETGQRWLASSVFEFASELPIVFRADLGSPGREVLLACALARDRYFGQSRAIWLTGRSTSLWSEPASSALRLLES
jgi:hypothetical protein